MRVGGTKLSEGGNQGKGGRGRDYSWGGGEPAYMAQGIGAVRQPKRGKIRVDLSAFEHLRAQFLLADHRVSQERFLLSYRSLRSRQLFAQCANFGLKLGDVAERPAQSLLMRQLEERDVVVWF